MKRLFALMTFCVSTLIWTSCNKEAMSPEHLDRHPDKTAEISITSRGSFDDTVTMFRDKDVYRKSDLEGQSWLIAHSGGKMVYDAFSLSIYFDCIDTLNAGDKINPSRCRFSFMLSSDSNATAHEYKGSISLAAKGNDYVIIHFNKVTFNCSFGKYTIDGYLECPLH